MFEVSKNLHSCWYNNFRPLEKNGDFPPFFFFKAAVDQSCNPKKEMGKDLHRRACLSEWKGLEKRSFLKGKLVSMEKMHPTKCLEQCDCRKHLTSCFSQRQAVRLTEEVMESNYAVCFVLEGQNKWSQALRSGRTVAFSCIFYTVLFVARQKTPASSLFLSCLRFLGLLQSLM